MSLRRTAVDGIGDVAWGTRISYLINSEEDIGIISHYIAEGLSNNELCVWVYSSDTNDREVHKELEKYISNIRHYYGKGNLRAISAKEWYNDGDFDESKKYKWVEFVNYALDHGYDGLRAVIDAMEIGQSNFQSFLNYQKKTYDLLQGLPYISMCLYNKDNIDISQYADIIDSHDYNILSDNKGLKINRNYRLAENDDIESIKIKTEMFSTLSHELRTPLNVIMSAIQLLHKMHEENDVNVNETKYLGMMQQNCYRLLKIVNNLIDISKIDSDFFELNMRNCNIVEVAENITLSAASYIESKGITIRFDTNTEERIIACDPEQIERVMLIILSNAARATPQGGNIWVKILHRENKVRIIIRDNETGIHDDKQRYIFEKFQQVNNYFIRQSEGSGIGLSLAKLLIEKHGGNVIFNCIAGRGCEYIIELPDVRIHGKNIEAYDKNIFRNQDFDEKIKLEFADIG